MDRGRLRWPVALVAALVAAEAAAFLFRPREGLIDPAPVGVRSYFSPAEVQRARDFRRPQFWLGMAATGVQAGLLVWLVARPPAILARSRRRPLLAAAAAGAALSVGLSMAALPISAVARQRAVDVGLTTQGWGGWAWDRARGEAIGGALAAGGALLLVALMRRMPRWWWAPASGAVVAAGALFLYAGPVVLDPIFNRFEPLEGRTRAEVLELARRAGVDVGEVYAMDASRRTTAANAYVGGLGRTKRVVLYDTLLRDFSPEEVRLVVAHELAHQHYDDLPHGLLYLAIVAPLGMWAVAQGVRALAPRTDGRATAAVLPAAALSLGIVQFGVGTVSNQLSRGVEARADAYALQLTRAPEPFIGFQRRIAVQNVSDPDPPGWRKFLFATHPSTLERIGIGEAFRARSSTGRGAPRSRTPEGS